MPEIWTYLGLFVLVSIVCCVQSAENGTATTTTCSPCNVTVCEKPVVPCGLEGETRDECRCCATCSKPNKEELCKTVQCPKRKVCTLNIQGIPMCRCPSTLSCPKRVRPTKRFCGSDGHTYKSRCAMVVGECERKTKLRVEHRGPCVHTEKDKKMQEKLKEKLAKKTRRKAKKERRRKKLLKRRRRMRRMMRTGFRKKRMN